MSIIDKLNELSEKIDTELARGDFLAEKVAGMPKKGVKFVPPRGDVNARAMAGMSKSLKRAQGAHADAVKRGNKAYAAASADAIATEKARLKAILRGDEAARFKQWHG